MGRQRLRSGLGTALAAGVARRAGADPRHARALRRRRVGGGTSTGDGRRAGAAQPVRPPAPARRADPRHRRARPPPCRRLLRAPGRPRRGARAALGTGDRALRGDHRRVPHRHGVAGIAAAARAAGDAGGRDRRPLPAERLGQPRRRRLLRRLLRPRRGLLRPARRRQRRRPRGGGARRHRPLHRARPRRAGAAAAGHSLADQRRLVACRTGGTVLHGRAGTLRAAGLREPAAERLARVRWAPAGVRDAPGRGRRGIGEHDRCPARRVRGRGRRRVRHLVATWRRRRLLHRRRHRGTQPGGRAARRERRGRRAALGGRALGGRRRPPPRARRARPPPAGPWRSSSSAGRTSGRARDPGRPTARPEGGARTA